MNELYALGGLVVAGYIWKGRELRAQLSMTGAGWDELHPEVKRRAAAVLQDANKLFKPQGLSVGIFEGKRTIARQLEVMGSGNSFLNDALRSYHVWGLAVDFVFLDRLGRWTWEPFGKDERAWYDIFSSDPNRDAWEKLGAIIKKHGFEWGGDWQNFDGPHAQWTGAGRSRELIAKYNDPSEVVWV